MGLSVARVVEFGEQSVVASEGAGLSLAHTLLLQVIVAIVVFVALDMLRFVLHRRRMRKAMSALTESLKNRSRAGDKNCSNSECCQKKSDDPGVTSFVQQGTTSDEQADFKKCLESQELPSGGVDELAEGCDPFQEGWPWKAGMTKESCECLGCRSGRALVSFLKKPDSDPSELSFIPKALVQVARANSGCMCEQCVAMRIRLNSKKVVGAGMLNFESSVKFEQVSVIGSPGEGKILVELAGGPCAGKKAWLSSPPPAHGTTYMIGSEFGDMSVYNIARDADGDLDSCAMYLGQESDAIVKEFFKQKGIPGVSSN